MTEGAAGPGLRMALAFTMALPTAKDFASATEIINGDKLSKSSRGVATIKSMREHF